MKGINRRSFLRDLSAGTLGFSALPFINGPVAGAAGAERTEGVDRTASTADWLTLWERYILRSARNRYCDRESGEEIGWLMSPFLEGFYYGYKATGNSAWVARLIDWADAWIGRAQKEPDGFRGWPKLGSGSTAEKGLLTDSLLGEAMALRPLVLMASAIATDNALKSRFAAQAESWLKLSQEIFKKWDTRGCWREVSNGGVWVVPPFGIDSQSGKWTDGFEHRTSDGFTNPANKQNHIARWLLAMHEATGEAVYRDRAEKWFCRMRSLMRSHAEGKYAIWNYWDPAGPWDYKPDGTTRHWVGVHPNGGYYAIDVTGIVAAFEHDLAFSRKDIEWLISTNRDFMWNQKVDGAKFQRIDGGQPDQRWKNSPGVLWSALVPYDSTLRQIFVGNHEPASWGGLAATPWFIHRSAEAPKH